MSNIPHQPGTGSGLGDSTGTGASTVYAPKLIIALIAAFALLLIVVQYFPHVIIGFMLLILVSVILARSVTILDILQL